MEILAKEAGFVRATSGTWQQQLKTAIRDAESLRKALGLPPAMGDLVAIEKSFGTFVPLPFLERIEPENANDPLLRQVLPTIAEGISSPQSLSDPNFERQSVMAPGVLQKYPGRVLLIAAKSCAVNCRYCFRRAFPYEAGPTSRDEWSESLAAIAADPSIEEVILSGGDPLVNLDEALAWLLGELSGIAHLRRLRIHTRFPIVIPQRVTEQLLAVLAECSLPITFVVHANHAQELDDNVARAMTRLRSVPQLILLNQSVLLRGVNDSVAALTALSWRLLELGIVPYYIHQLDRVTGADHFEVSREEGLALIAALRESLPGYAVPRYAKEISGERSKVILA